MVRLMLSQSGGLAIKWERNRATPVEFGQVVENWKQLTHHGLNPKVRQCQLLGLASETRIQIVLQASRVITRHPESLLWIELVVVLGFARELSPVGLPHHYQSLGS